ncbi:MAG: aminoacyl-tRNA hydrolase [Pseudomonadota bacterium]
MILVVGLGNPGKEYVKHRHNIGFQAIEAVAVAHNFDSFKLKDAGLLAQGQLAGEKVFLLKPMTYMNLSGRSVAQIARFYKIPLDKIYVIHDDIDLQPGQVRVKQGGGAGGHNGLKSIDSTMGKDYWRIRIGVGHPGHRDQVSGYVLHNFSKYDEKWIEALLPEIAAALPDLLQGERDKFLTYLGMQAASKKKKLQKDQKQKDKKDGI